jgi:uncharacterized membrane protein
LIVGAIAYAVGWRPPFNQTGPGQTGRTPLEILYARGEISREEYEQVRQDLQG